MTPFHPKICKNKKGVPIIDSAVVTSGPKGGKTGKLDKQGRIWVWDPPHAGYPGHWDVQLDGGGDYFRVGTDGNPVMRR